MEKKILRNPKDKTDKLEISELYKRGCDDCDQIYVGQTMRSIETRIREHDWNMIGTCF